MPLLLVNLNVRARHANPCALSCLSERPSKLTIHLSFIVSYYIDVEHTGMPQYCPWP
jgi:hypothetical protein